MVIEGMRNGNEMGRRERSRGKKVDLGEWVKSKCKSKREKIFRSAIL